MQRACTDCKQKFYDSKVASLKESNISRWWRELKGLTGQRARTDWVTQFLDEDTPSPAALAEKFNSFLAALTSHFTPLDTSPTDVDHNLDVPREFLVDASSCYKALRRVKNNKSPGPSAVPNKIWKEFAFELAPVVTDNYNASLVQGFIPYQIKESVVTPLPKCSSPKCIKNDLRPITLTSQIAKIFEGFMLAPLFNQVIDRIDLKQFALPGRSTTHALVYLLHCILEALDNSHCYARILFTDFSKAFDLVDHSVLVSELRDLGGA